MGRGDGLDGGGRRNGGDRGNGFQGRRRGRGFFKGGDRRRGNRVPNKSLSFQMKNSKTQIY